MAAIDPSPKSFPILSYVLSRIPSITHLRQSPPQTTAAAADHDIEQPPPAADVVDPLIEQMPHLKDPKVIAAMAKAVSEIAQTRSVLQALGERPDHETVDIAKVELAKIEAELSDQLEEIELSPGVSGESGKQKREALEKEKTMYKAVLQVDEMHDAYQKLLNDAEERLMKIYDSVVENGKEGEEEGVDEEVNEEVVAVLRQQTIERVDLSGRKLKILPEAIGRLRGLVSLDLSTNQLQAIPDSIAGCENLEELNLSSNSLQSLPDSIGLLLKLRILNVAGNKLSALPDSISNCRSLVELDAGFNALGYLPTTMGFELVNLRKLLVPYNKIRFLPTSIGEMKSLQHLDAHFNELHNVPVTIGQLTNLVTLNLSGNFSDMKELPDTFCDLFNLEELDLSNNQIHALPDQFSRLGKLKKLNLEQNPIVIPPMEVINNGIEAVRTYMDERWADLLEEEERARQEVEEVKEGGWLKRSVSKLGGVVSSVSEYLGSPKSQDPCLDQQL